MGFVKLPSKRWGVGIILVLGVTTGAMVLTNVPERVTSEDAEVAMRLLENTPKLGPQSQSSISFDDQLALVAMVQAVILGATPVVDSIPRRQPRELKNLVAEGKGLCFDRSRGIEQLFRFLGLETRHVAVFRIRQGEHPLRVLLRRGTESHAISEVRTNRGWMLLGSNYPWMALDEAGAPLDAVAFSQARNRLHLTQTTDSLPGDHWFFSGTWVPIRGLYSRHGEFHPPYWFVPDVNWLGLLQNWEILPLLLP